VKVVSEEFKSKACGKTFKTKEELMEHVEKDHAM
jgi:hypothetical protein